MIKGFKDFLLRGNVIDLAIAVVIGAAFTAVVTALATDVIGGFIAAIFQQPDMSGLGFDIGDGRVVLGTTVAALINFVIVAAVIYFLIVVPMNRLLALRKQGVEPEVAAPSEDILLLQEIRDLLRAQAEQQRREP
ncbi:large conductance mechanosensitive channel protein MscL [Pseudokineococcus lusitanus]|jgi:large conductance mechanosensitive channel|uniref:Large-conductance mechanosensitive channel n=1 Tax=Pseudokineococcus lusitanus TaxID=763993 RepID=A0A3N1HK90_9ACTN|nr:large conductance mechanosensitive channel protein MscL [Pseudokineococcus lusitanus]ROP42947.1 large conductance mechanosensitive channel [Pseudokineococcus lusitanus]